MRFSSGSAILPLIAEEHTSDHARRYYEANPELVVWWGASVECASALAPLECDGALETRDLTQALQQLQARESAWNEVHPFGHSARSRTTTVAPAPTARRRRIAVGRGPGGGRPSTAGV